MIMVLHESMVVFGTLKNRDYSGFNRYLMHDTLNLAAHYVQFLSHTAANVLADCVLIHRCYLLWDKKQMIILLAAACFLANAILLIGTILSALGYRDLDSEKSRILVVEGQTLFASAMIATGVLNVVLTCLTAGRIWWIGIRPGQSLGVTLTYAKKYRTLLRIILESGIIYPLTTAVHLVVLNCLTPDQIPFDSFPLVVLAAAIAPTLIVIRARLGMTSTPTVEDIPSYSQISFRVAQRSTIRSGAAIDRDEV
ncbi:hypothetical protein PM082_013717 [Marasmius tenuissimus]|nr:hypothetical protein PM082_013717 [Marasmius tenuissimus]